MPDDDAFRESPRAAAAVRQMTQRAEINGDGHQLSIIPMMEMPRGASRRHLGPGQAVAGLPPAMVAFLNQAPEAAENSRQTHAISRISEMTVSA